MKELGGLQIAVLSAPVSQRRIGAHVSSSRSCSVQEYGSARASLVRVRSAGGVLSRSADTIRGETKASGANNRMCRSTLTVPGTGLAQVTAIVLTFAMGRPDEFRYWH